MISLGHSCPDCGQACYCDIEDTLWDDPEECCHDCGPEFEGDDDDDD